MKDCWEEGLAAGSRVSVTDQGHVSQSLTNAYPKAKTLDP